MSVPRSAHKSLSVMALFAACSVRSRRPEESECPVTLRLSTFVFLAALSLPLISQPAWAQDGRQGLAQKVGGSQTSAGAGEGPARAEAPPTDAALDEEGDIWEELAEPFVLVAEQVQRLYLELRDSVLGDSAARDAAGPPASSDRPLNRVRHPSELLLGEDPPADTD